MEHLNHGGLPKCSAVHIGMHTICGVTCILRPLVQAENIFHFVAHCLFYYIHFVPSFTVASFYYYMLINWSLVCSMCVSIVGSTTYQGGFAKYCVAEYNSDYLFFTGVY